MDDHMETEIHLYPKGEKQTFGNLVKCIVFNKTT